MKNKHVVKSINDVRLSVPSVAEIVTQMSFAQTSCMSPKRAILGRLLVASLSLLSLSLCSAVLVLFLANKSMMIMMMTMKKATN